MTASSNRIRVYSAQGVFVLLTVIFTLAFMIPVNADAKMRVAVTAFENKVTGVYGNWDLGEGMAEMLATELYKSGQFIVLERTAMDDILREQELGQSGLVRSETAARTGQMLGAQVIVRGAVTEFSDAASGFGGDYRDDQFDIGAKASNAHVGIDLRLIDASTGQVIASHNISKKARSAGGRVDYSESDLQIGAGGFIKTPLGQATREAIAEAVAFVSRSVPTGSSGTTSSGLKIIKSDGRKIYINGGLNRGLSVGDRYSVYSVGEALIDPDTGLQLGSTDEMIGVIEIAEVKEKYAIAHPLSGSGFKRGNSLRVR
jgi:curli biogenesis system outer membrane secretion channel CsgG